MIQQIIRTKKTVIKIGILKQNAQGLIEYGLIVILIALVVMGILGLLGGQLDQTYQAIIDAIAP
jgi:Flp pilus assembly pilin Flp